MTEVQIWFEPLLWIIGTIAALAAFVRLCNPLWRIFQSPKEISEALSNLDKKFEKHFQSSAERLDRLEEGLLALEEHNEHIKLSQIDLLQDRISQGFNYFNHLTHISQDGYRSLCELYKSYKRLGGNSYIDTIMEQIEELYKKSSQNTEN